MSCDGDVVQLTRRLVRLPSDETSTAVGDLIESWLRAETDASVRRDAHGNIFAWRNKGGDTIGLVGHHDVVPPAPNQVETDEDGTRRFIIEQEGNRLYGRGTADMKGSLAAAMIAFRDAQINRSAVFVSFTGEEDGGLGAQAAIDDGFVPEVAIVCEGSTNYAGVDQTDVVIAHKGRRASTIVAHGSAAHASEPGSGVNAVYRGIDAIERLRSLDPPQTTVAGMELTGSVAVTKVIGGETWNVIPDRCVITVDERTVPGGKMPLDRLNEATGVTWAVDQDLPPMACENPRFARIAHEAATTAQDGDTVLVTKAAATDAGWLTQAGTDCLVIGASEPEEAHTPEESVSITALHRCSTIYQSVLEAW